MEPGQIGNETIVEITAKNISEYARLALNDSPSYHPDAGSLVAMPTMVLSYAPLLREEIAEANGFVAFEVSKRPGARPLSLNAKSGGSTRWSTVTPSPGGVGVLRSMNGGAASS